MPSPLPKVPFRPLHVAATRRTFLRYSGAGAAVGGLWLAGCKATPDPVAPAIPTLASFTPTSGMPGATITLTGTNLAGTTAVKLGTAPVVFTVVNATTITFTVPTGASTAPITVTTPAGTVTSSTAFAVTAAPATAPTITSLAPTSALPGTSVTVTGTNLGNVSGVTVNSIGTSFSTYGTTSLNFIVPTNAQAGPATVVLTAPTGTATTALTVLPSTVNVGSGDVGVLNYAYALEQVEAAFYNQVRKGSYYLGLGSTSAEKQIFDDLYYHETIHREFLKAALTAAGTTPLKDLTMDFSTLNFSDRTSVLTAAKTFEDLGSAAYIGAGQYLSSPGYLLIAGKISSVEARHAAIIRDLVSEGTFVGSDITNSSSIEQAKLPIDVAPVVNQYLAIGSQLDVSGIK
ncbi:MAG: ferritin-like domain-containing protein [Janthinobacterium lividum]